MDDNKSRRIRINIFMNIFIDVIKKWQFILFVSVLVATSYDVYKTVTYTPVYESNAIFVVKTNSGASSNDASEVGESFKYIFQSNIFKKVMSEHLGVANLNGTYSASIYNNTNVLTVTAKSNSRKTAYDMMIALKENYKELSNLVVGSSNIDVLNDVSIPVYPINSINHMKNLVIMGILVACGMIFGCSCLSFMKNTIKVKDEISSKLNLNIVGDLPKESKTINFLKNKKKKMILITQHSTSFQYVESIKKIRNFIERYSKKHHSKMYLLTSSLENEGKSSVAVNLAISLAMNNKKVLLIDGDIRKASLHLILEQKQSKYDINDVLVNNIDLMDAVVHIPKFKFDVLLGYNNVENQEDVLNSDAMVAMFKCAKENYEYIIVDSAPSRYLSDTREMPRYMDGILLVVKQDFALVSTISTTIEKLSLSNVPIIGCINNQSYTLGTNSYGYGYYRYRNRYDTRKSEGDL